MENIKVLIADAHFLTREGLKFLISNQHDYLITGEAKDNKALNESLNVALPDILIMDYNAGNCFSIHDLIGIREKYPAIGILVISNNINKKDILATLESGVCGYLLKECDEEEIVNALRSVYKREKFLCGKVLDIILDKPGANCTFEQSCDSCDPVKLSNRELEVVKLIAKGFTTKDIAGRLFLSNHTVATHRKNIFKKIGINNSMELVRYAMRIGIVSLT